MDIELKTEPVVTMDDSSRGLQLLPNWCWSMQKSVDTTTMDQSLTCAEQLIDSDASHLTTSNNLTENGCVNETAKRLESQSTVSAEFDASSMTAHIKPIEILPIDVQEEEHQPENDGKVATAKRQIDFSQPRGHRPTLTRESPKGSLTDIQMEEHCLAGQQFEKQTSKLDVDFTEEEVYIPSWKKNPGNVANARKKLNEKLGELISKVEKRVQPHDRLPDDVEQVADTDLTDEEEDGGFEQFSDDSEEDSGSDWSDTTESSTVSRHTPSEEIATKLATTEKAGTSEAQNSQFKVPLYCYGKNKERCIVGYVESGRPDSETKTINIDRLVKIANACKQKNLDVTQCTPQGGESADPIKTPEGVNEGISVKNVAKPLGVCKVTTLNNNEMKCDAEIKHEGVGIIDSIESLSTENRMSASSPGKHNNNELSICNVTTLTEDSIQIKCENVGVITSCESLAGKDQSTDVNVCTNQWVNSSTSTNAMTFDMAAFDYKLDPEYNVDHGSNEDQCQPERLLTGEDLPKLTEYSAVSSTASQSEALVEVDMPKLKPEMSRTLPPDGRDPDLEKFVIQGSPSKKKQNAFVSSELDAYLDRYGASEGDQRVPSDKVTECIDGDGFSITGQSQANKDPGVDFEEIDGLPFYCCDSEENLSCQSKAPSLGKKTSDVKNIKGWKRKFRGIMSTDNDDSGNKKQQEEGEGHADTPVCKKAKVVLKKVDLEDLSRMGLRCHDLEAAADELDHSADGIEVYKRRSYVKSVKLLATEAEQPKQGKIYGRTGAGRFATKSNVLKRVKSSKTSTRQQPVKELDKTYETNSPPASHPSSWRGVEHFRKKTKLVMPYLSAQWIEDALQALYIPDRSKLSAEKQDAVKTATEVECVDLTQSEEVEMWRDTETIRSKNAGEMHNRLRKSQDTLGGQEGSDSEGLGASPRRCKRLLRDSVGRDESDDHEMKISGVSDPVYDYDPDSNPNSYPLPQGSEVTSCGCDHCRLGCVCQSLAQCDTRQVLKKQHCGREDCVLGCQCNYSYKIAKTHDMWDKYISGKDGLVEVEHGLKRSRRLQDKSVVMWNRLVQARGVDMVEEEIDELVELNTCARTDEYRPLEMNKIARIHEMLDKEISEQDGLVEVEHGLKRSPRLQDKSVVTQNQVVEGRDVEVCFEVDSDSDELVELSDTEETYTCARTTVYRPLRMQQNTNTAPTYNTMTPTATEKASKSPRHAPVLMSHLDDSLSAKEKSATVDKTDEKVTAEEQDKETSNDVKITRTERCKRPFKTQMLLLQRKKLDRNSMPHLLEVKSNCNWERFRSAILSRISEMAEAEGYPSPCVLVVNNLYVAVLPKPIFPTRIPTHLQNLLKSPTMFHISLRITEANNEETIDLTAGDSPPADENERFPTNGANHDIQQYVTPGTRVKCPSSGAKDKGPENRPSLPPKELGVSGLSSLQVSLPGMKKTGTGGFDFLHGENIDQPLDSATRNQPNQRDSMSTKQSGTKQTGADRKFKNLENKASRIRVAPRRSEGDVIVLDDDSDSEETGSSENGGGQGVTSPVPKVMPTYLVMNYNHKPSSTSISGEEPNQKAMVSLLSKDGMGSKTTPVSSNQTSTLNSDVTVDKVVGGSALSRQLEQSKPAPTSEKSGLLQTTTGQKPKSATLLKGQQTVTPASTPATSTNAKTTVTFQLPQGSLRTSLLNKDKLKGSQQLVCIQNPLPGSQKKQPGSSQGKSTNMPPAGVPILITGSQLKEPKILFPVSRNSPADKQKKIFLLSSKDGHQAKLMGSPDGQTRLFPVVISAANIPRLSSPSSKTNSKCGTGRVKKGQKSGTEEGKSPIQIFSTAACSIQGNTNGKTGEDSKTSTNVKCPQTSKKRKCRSKTEVQAEEKIVSAIQVNIGTGNAEVQDIRLPFSTLLTKAVQSSIKGLKNKPGDTSTSKSTGTESVQKKTQLKEEGGRVSGSSQVQSDTTEQRQKPPLIDSDEKQFPVKKTDFCSPKIQLKGIFVVREADTLDSSVKPSCVENKACGSATKSCDHKSKSCDTANLIEWQEGMILDDQSGETYFPNGKALTSEGKLPDKDCTEEICRGENMNKNCPELIPDRENLNKHCSVVTPGRENLYEDCTETTPEPDSVNKENTTEQDSENKDCATDQNFVNKKQDSVNKEDTTEQDSASEDGSNGQDSVNKEDATEENSLNKKQDSVNKETRITDQDSDNEKSSTGQDTVSKESFTEHDSLNKEQDSVNKECSTEQDSENKDGSTGQICHSKEGPTEQHSVNKEDSTQSSTGDKGEVTDLDTGDKKGATEQDSDSANKEGTTEQDSANKEGNIERKYANKEGTTEQESANKEGSTEQDSSNKEGTTEQDSSNKEGTTEQDSTNKVGTTEQDSANKEGTTEQDSTNKEGTTEQDSTNKEGTTEQDSTNKEGTTEQDSSHKERITEQDSTNKVGTTEQDSAKKEGTTEQDSANIEGTTEQDSINKEGTTDQDSAKKEGTTEQDSANKEDTTEQDSANKVGTSEQDSANKEGTAEQDSTKKEGTTEQDSTKKEGTTEQDSANKEGTTEQDSTNKEGSTEQDSAKKEGTTEQDSANIEGTTEQDSINKEGTTDQDSAKKEGTTEQDSANKEDTTEQDSANKVDTSEQDSANKEGTAEQDSASTEGTTEQDLANKKYATEQNFMDKNHTSEQDSVCKERTSKQDSANKVCLTDKISVNIQHTSEQHCITREAAAEYSVDKSDNVALTGINTDDTDESEEIDVDGSSESYSVDTHISVVDDVSGTGNEVGNFKCGNCDDGTGSALQQMLTADSVGQAHQDLMGRKSADQVIQSKHKKNPEARQYKPESKQIEKSDEEDEVEIMKPSIKFHMTAAAILKAELDRSNALGATSGSKCTSFKKRKQGLQQRWPVNNDSSMVFTEKEVISADRYRSYKIVSVVEESEDIKRFRFALGTNEKLPLRLGQHLILRWVNVDGTITRQYTPIGDCSKSGFFDVAIKIYSDGRMSEYLKTWGIGSSIEWRGPFGDFQYIPNKYDSIILLAAGTGIAPMVQVIRHILNNEQDETMIELMYSVRHYSSVMCRDLLDSWKEFWNFKLTYYVTQDEPGDVELKYGDKVVFGRINIESVKQRLNSSKTYFCICGTKPFDKDMIKLLKTLEFTEDSYHKF